MDKAMESLKQSLPLCVQVELVLIFCLGSQNVMALFSLKASSVIHVQDTSTLVVTPLIKYY